MYAAQSLHENAMGVFCLCFYVNGVYHTGGAVSDLSDQDPAPYHINPKRIKKKKAPGSDNTQAGPLNTPINIVNRRPGLTC